MINQNIPEATIYTQKFAWKHNFWVNAEAMDRNPEKHLQELLKNSLTE